MGTHMKVAAFIAALASLSAAGCGVVGSLAGAGASAAVREEQQERRHEKASEVAETFAQPLQRTRSAALAALKRMAIEVRESSSSDKDAHITGTMRDQPVEIHLTALTEKATRMNVKVGDGDKATAQKIVEQARSAISGAGKGQSSAFRRKKARPMPRFPEPHVFTERSSTRS